jgi:DNA-binding NarL/FixJ family response regulator
MRVVLIDQQPLVREGLACVLQREAGFLFCGSASNARDGLWLLQEEEPDLVMLDLCLPGLSGIAATREIARRWPAMAAVILSASCCERDVLDALRAGALAYLGKNDPVESVMEGLRAAARGERYLGPCVRMLSLPPLSRRREDQRGTPEVLGALSDREREVFDLAIRGFRNREIARELCIAVKTVGSHRLQINRKLGCSSGTELVYFAATNGLLPIPVSEGPLLMEPTPSEDDADAVHVAS